MRAVLATLVTGVVVLAVPGQAAAKRMERDDPVGDVYRLGTAGGTRMSGTLENTDATRVVIDHRLSGLLTSVKYDSVSGSGFEEIYLEEYIRTSYGGSFHVFVRLDNHLRHATMQLRDLVKEAPVSCPGARASVNRDAQRVRWVLPRACLGNPKLLQVRGWAGSVTENVVRYGDDLLSDDRPGHRWTRQLWVD
jgi:hypothetical protein